MIGNKYKLFGTNNILEIIGEDDIYWVISISSANDNELDILMKKDNLDDSIMLNNLIKI